MLAVTAVVDIVCMGGGGGIGAEGNGGPKHTVKADTSSDAGSWSSFFSSPPLMLTLVPLLLCLFFFTAAPLDYESTILSCLSKLRGLAFSSTRLLADVVHAVNAPVEVSDPNGAFVVVVVASGKKGSANSSNTRRGNVVDDFAKGSVLQNAAVTSNGSTNEAPEVATACLWSGPLFFNREGGEA